MAAAQHSSAGKPVYQHAAWRWDNACLVVDLTPDPPPPRAYDAPIIPYRRRRRRPRPIVRRPPLLREPNTKRARSAVQRVAAFVVSRK